MSGFTEITTLPAAWAKSAAILSGFDGAGAFAGRAVFSRGEATIHIPAATGQACNGRYLDAVQFLNGYGSQRTLSADAAALWLACAGEGTASCGIDASDRFYVHATGPFTVGASDGNPWGLATAAASVVHGTGWRVTAPGRWRRGPVDVRALLGQFVVSPTGGVPFLLPSTASVVHSLPTMLRGAEGDADDATTACLETWDNDAADSDPSYRRIRWGIDGTGRVFSSWRLAEEPLTWLDTDACKAFRKALGFTGEEVATPYGGHLTLTATWPCPGVLIVRRGLDAWEPEALERGDVVELPDGSVRGALHGTGAQWRGRFSVGGLADLVDDEGHMLRAVAPRISRGARCSIHLAWGDPRRGRHVAELVDGGPVTPFSHSVTCELGGLLGRRVGRVSPDSPDSRRWSYQDVRVRSVHELVLRESD